MNYLERAREEVEEAKKRMDHAYEVIPDEYHWYIVQLKKNKKIGTCTKRIEISSEASELGMWQNKSGDVYVTVYEPYMSVDGRVKWARDEHKKAGKKLIFCPPVIDKNLVSVTVKSEIYGEATGTAKIGNSNNGGVDSTNPVENAETSAIGRALGFLGYGLLGTGIASAEEVVLADKDRKHMAEKTTNTPAENSMPGKHSENLKVFNMREKVSGVIADYKVSGDYLAIILDTGEKIIFPSSYPAFADTPPEKGAQVEIEVVKRGKKIFVAGTSGNEFVIKKEEAEEVDETSDYQIPDEVPF